jgi:hypothetical protein
VRATKQQSLLKTKARLWESEQVMKNILSDCVGTKKREEMGEDKDEDKESVDNSNILSRFEFRKPTDYAAIAFIQKKN